jgi:hypothetical protein
MFPTGSNPGFYPPDEQIGPQTTRNRAAVLRFLDASDCVYEVIGLTCGGGQAPTTIYSDDFEAANGWTVNPNGTDTATAGQWVRGNPAGTNSGGVKQLDATVSGSNDLVTGAAAGASAGEFDVDGGVTTIRSGPITLTAGFGSYTLQFSQYLAHGSNSSSADYLRVFVETSSGARTQVFSRSGAATNVNGAWAPGSASLNAFAGQTVRLVVQAADASTASLVEAGVDDVRITGV